MLLTGLVLVLSSLPLPPVGPAPAWVEALDTPAPPDKPSGASHTLLHDTQVRVADSVETYERRVWKVLNQPGVEALATQQLEWNPAYETLTLHGVWVWRNGKRRDAWHPDDARVLPVENDLTAGLYDGRQQLVLELRDVRPGDLVEYAYTRRGENPVFKGHVTLWAEQAADAPVSLLNFSLTWLRPAPLHATPRGGAVEPTVTPVTDGTRYAWSLRDVPLLDWEPRTPTDVVQLPHVVFTDWADWSAVRAWAEPLFAQPAKGEDFDDLVKRLRALPEAERAREAVRLVQDDVRYVGVELGEHSHQPHAPAWVLERGFGDCKDKALLLVSLLRAVDIDAWPVLVNSEAAPGFDATPPSASAFDHAIALVQLPTGPLFIDATATLNRGPLETREVLPYRYALVVREGETGLVPIEQPMPKEPTWDVTQRWVTHLDGSAALTVVTVARGHEAPTLRRAIERDTKAELERTWRERRVGQLSTELTMTDFEWDDDGETFTLTERYSVASFFAKDEEHSFETLVIDGDLTWVPETPRTRPLLVKAPLHVRERIEWVDTSALEAPRFTTTNETISSDVFALDVKQAVKAGVLHLEWTLKNTAPRLEVAHFAAHRTATKRASETTGYVVTSGRGGVGGTSAETSTWTVVLALVGGMAVVGFIIVTFTAANERWQKWKSGARIRAFAKLHVADAGEAPASAVTLRTEAEGAALFRSAKCPRGHDWAEVKQSEHVRFGDDRLTVLTRRCTTCDAVEHRYVRLPG